MSSILNEIIIYHLHPCSRLDMLSQFILVLPVFRERENQRVLVWAALGIVWILSGPPWNLSGKRHLGGFCVSVLPSCDLNGTSEVTTRSYVCLCCQVVTSAAPRRSQTRSFLCLCCQVVTSAAPRSSHTRSFVCLCCQVKPQRHFGGRKRDPLV